jgi:hypothetical protein
MKRLLWLVCLCSSSALALTACGDDDGGGDGTEDGGVSFGDLDALGNRVDNLSGQLNGLDRDLGDLADTVDELGSDLGDLSDLVDDINGRLTGLETPVSCSETELCIPDGLDLAKEGMEALVRTVCELELNCCTDDELALLWGAGITNADECVEAFMSMVDNGITPSFLDIDSLVDEGILGYVIDLAQALNNTQVKVGLHAENVQACLAWLEDRECPDPLADVEYPEHCDPDYEQHENPCSPWKLIQGRQQAGELCGLTQLNECEEGLICRYVTYNQGICATPAEEDDSCRTDWDCDALSTELFCNAQTGKCEERGDEGDPCAYVDPSFSLSHSELNPYYVGNRLQNPAAVARECKSGLSCDPNSRECVSFCSEGWLCYSNQDCPSGATCNFTQNPTLRNTWGRGVCREAVEDGDPCHHLDGRECASRRCGTGISGRECLPALIPAGGDCTTNVAGLGNTSSVCATGYCAADSTTTTAGKCATRCDQLSECPNTHFCDWNVIGLDYHEDGSYPCDLKRANDDDCDAWYDEGVAAGRWTNVQCASGYCDNVLETCAAKASAGGSCTTGQDSACPNNQYCNPGNGTCTNFIATNGDCSASGDAGCGPGNYCLYNATGPSYTCRPFGGVGDDCSGGRQCNWYDGDMDCVSVGSNQQCHRYGEFPIGATCYSSDGYCASTWCRLSDNTCRAPIEEGEDCDADDPATERCEQGTFCKYALDESPLTYEGECTAQGRTGDTCDPRYQNSGDPDCLGSDCGLNNGQVTCGRYSSEADPVCLWPVY